MVPAAQSDGDSETHVWSERLVTYRAFAEDLYNSVESEQVVLVTVRYLLVDQHFLDKPFEPVSPGQLHRLQLSLIHTHTMLLTSTVMLLVMLLLNF